MTERETTQDRVEMIHKEAKEQSYLDSMEYDEKVEYAQYQDRKEAPKDKTNLLEIKQILFCILVVLACDLGMRVWPDVAALLLGVL